jgi:hypothetical protein
LYNDSGKINVSLASAFENARLKLLADSKTLQSLFNLRAHIADAALRMKKKNHPAENNSWNAMLDTLISAAEKSIDMGNLKPIQENSKVDTSIVIGEDFIIPESPEVKTFAEAVYNIAFQTADTAAMLFSDDKIIPNESINFFHIDKNIIRAALDGIFSVGIESEHEKKINIVLYKYVRDFIFYNSDAKLKDEITGFILRSSIMEKWKDTECYAFDAKGTELPLFETRELSENLYVFFYKGIIAKIILREAAHELCSGLTSNDELMVKSNSEIKNIKLTRECFKKDDERSISAAEIIKATSSFCDAKKSSQFGLNFLRIPEQVICEVK